MRLIEYKKIYHPKLGRFVYKHKGSGIIIDNLFKPIKAIFKSVVKPFAKKTLDAGVSHAGERLGKAVSQKSGDYIMKKLHSIRNTKPTEPKQESSVTKPKPKQEESTDMILNRLISGDGIRRKK